MLFSIISSGNIREAIIGVLLMIPVALLALSAHEAAHGLAAYMMGDRTAYNMGRVTLNPSKHLDLFGTLMMLVFGFGWAKPVPINARNFKNPKWGMALSALAGPLSNIILGSIGAIFAGSLYYLTGFIVPVYAPQITEFAYYEALNSVIFDFATYFGLINFIYAFFNLIPLPPFDGSRFFFTFLPVKWYFGIMKYERYIMFGLLILIMASSRFLQFSPFSYLAENAYLLIANGTLRLFDTVFTLIINLIA